jgi:hypothetical protein
MLVFASFNEFLYDPSCIIAYMRKEINSFESISLFIFDLPRSLAILILVLLA